MNEKLKTQSIEFDATSAGFALAFASLNMQLAELKNLHEVMFGTTITTPAGPTGARVSSPRLDGAVLSFDFSDLIDKCLESSDPVEKAWAHEVHDAQWIFIQDTFELPNLTENQRNHINLNCTRARLSALWLGKGGKLWSYFASPWAINERTKVPYLVDRMIPDAFALPSDFVYANGFVQSEGTRVRDMPAFARNSLQHFRTTRGDAVLAGNWQLKPIKKS